MTIASDLLHLKNKIETAKTEMARLEGREQEAMRRLKDEFQVSTLEEASALRDKLQGELDAIDSEIEAGVAKLKEKMA